MANLHQRRSGLRHPGWERQWNAVGAPDDVMRLLVHMVPSNDGKALSAKRMKTVLDRYYRWIGFVGSMSVTCSNGSSSTCASSPFFGVTENAVKTQIWIAVAIYVLVAIVKKRLNVSTDLYTILQVLSLTLLEKIPLFPLLSKTDYILDKDDSGKQRDLFENLMGH